MTFLVIFGLWTCGMYGYCFSLLLRQQCVASQLAPDTVDDDGSSSASEAVASAPPPSSVREVEYDEHGQTWDVYGAEFDPEILGQAIQTHLEHIMQGRRQHSATTEAESVEHVATQTQVIKTRQARDKRDSINRFFLRYIRTGASTVNG